MFLVSPFPSGLSSIFPGVSFSIFPTSDITRGNIKKHGQKVSDVTLGDVTCHPGIIHRNFSMKKTAEQSAAGTKTLFLSFELLLPCYPVKYPVCTRQG